MKEMRNLKTPIDTIQENFQNSRLEVSLSFRSIGKPYHYEVERVEIGNILDVEYPIRYQFTITTLKALRELIENSRDVARKESRELVIIDKDANSEYRSITQVNNFIENCHDRQRVIKYNNNIRRNHINRQPRIKKVKQIDMRIFENRS